MCSDKQTEPHLHQTTPQQQCSANCVPETMTVNSNNHEEAQRTAIKMMQRWMLQYSILMEQCEQMVQKQHAKAERFWNRTATMYVERVCEKWSQRAKTH
mmetsp:Transcript_56521/g.100688  ORF Transcript_56521/g.100688 Transcript_56521/m.100688 type:complete len:99 (+) Transcript_56521:677-973(+)